MDSSLQRSLHRYNPWLERPGEQASLLSSALPDPMVPRQLTLELRPGQVELVTGPSRSGKSTWIRDVLRSLRDPVLILDCREPAVKRLADAPNHAAGLLAEYLDQRTIVVLEEAQALLEPAALIAAMLQGPTGEARRVVATGSSSFIGDPEAWKVLDGRCRETLVLPLSLEEASAIVDGQVQGEQPEHLRSAQWERLLVCGGFPSVWFDPEPQSALRKMVSAEMLDPAFEQHAIGRPAVFRKLLEIAAADSGRMVNISEWASAAEASRTTVMRYVEIAEQAHLLHLLPPFSGGKRAEVTGASKVCFIDNGVRNAFHGGFMPSRLRGDGNALWQNAVYGELRKRLPAGCDIRYWRSRNGAEIDFMISCADKVLAIEVRSRPLREAKLTRGVRGFLEIYKPDCLGVINKSVRHDYVDFGVDVRFRMPWELDELLDVVRS